MIQHQENSRVEIRARLFECSTFEMPSLEVIASFEHLEEDNYLKGPFIFRKRAYSLARLSPSGVEWQNSVPFFQPSTLNRYAGNILREFAPVSTCTRQFISALLRVNPYVALMHNEYCFLGVHQIRVLTDEGHVGFPAPEGTHQDGFDTVGVFCIRTQNIEGGTSILTDAADGRCVFSAHLKPGEALVFDDRRVFHYTTPIHPKVPAPGFRDVFVLTFLHHSIEQEAP